MSPCLERKLFLLCLVIIDSCINLQIEGATRLAEIKKVYVRNASELRIGCVYLAPYGDSVVGHTYYRARLEKVYGDGAGCTVKVI